MKPDKAMPDGESSDQSRTRLAGFLQHLGGGAGEAQMIRRAIMSPIRWWTKHPWIPWWGTTLLGPWAMQRLLDVALSRCLADEVLLVKISLAVFATAWIASFVLGALVTTQSSEIWRAFAIGVLATVAGFFWGTPLMQDISPRARTAKAQQDTRAIASAMTQYSAHCGDLPGQPGDVCAPGGAGTAALVAQQTNAGGQTAGPWFAGPGPVPPDGWCPAGPCAPADYAITVPRPGGTGTFQVVAGPPTNGDNCGNRVTAP